MSFTKKQLAITKIEIGKLELKTGDVLVVKFPKTVNLENTAALEDSLKRILPEGVNVMLITTDVELSVLESEQ